MTAEILKIQDNSHVEPSHFHTPVGCDNKFPVTTTASRSHKVYIAARGIPQVPPCSCRAAIILAMRKLRRGYASRLWTSGTRSHFAGICLAFRKIGPSAVALLLACAPGPQLRRLGGESGGSRHHTTAPRYVSAVSASAAKAASITNPISAMVANAPRTIPGVTSLRHPACVSMFTSVAFVGVAS